GSVFDLRTVQIHQKGRFPGLKPCRLTKTRCVLVGFCEKTDRAGRKIALERPARTAAVAAIGSGVRFVEFSSGSRVHSPFAEVPMKLAVPKETVPGERRVALIPESIKRLTGKKFAVVVEAGAGGGANISDDEMKAAGAEIAADAAALYAAADL